MIYKTNNDMKYSLTYDDIQLVPDYSAIKTRTKINLHTLVSRRYGLLRPFVASPMDTVCELDMAYKMMLQGGVGCIHRFMTEKEQARQVSKLQYKIYAEGEDVSPAEDWGVMFDTWHAEERYVPIMAAVGVGNNGIKRAEILVEAGANIILIDVAHGHHENVRKTIEGIRKKVPSHVDIIAGNIATAQAAIDLQEWGVDGLRVGIGGGSLCTTRVKTGFGVPNITSLEEISKVAEVPVMADGGIRTSGDIAKALAVGADCVMLGSLLAGTEESPGEIMETSIGLYKRYRGSASIETKVAHKQVTRNVEGESTTIPYKGGVKFIIDGLTDGVRSALSYAGADSLKTYHPEYVVVTNSGIAEAKPHGSK
jgi:IMP dehydrogenase